jgi:hypothetical protein
MILITPPQENLLHIILSYNTCIMIINKFMQTFSDLAQIFNFTTSSWPEKSRILPSSPSLKRFPAQAVQDRAVAILKHEIIRIGVTDDDCIC